ncbi:MAG: ankyrin repeat domain-containing protein [Phycisphaerales bacterium]|nr:ankyrin repeat domain-containing protein [Phycisphaerales bacterium]
MSRPSRRTILAHGLAVTGAATFSRFLRADPADRRAFLDAVRGGHLDRCRAMLDAHPDLARSCDDLGRSAFALALLHHHPAIAAAIRPLAPDLDLHESALALDWERFEALAAAAPDRVRDEHPIGGSAMVAAALGGAGTQIWRVYQFGADPNQPVRVDALTPLLAALTVPDLPTAEMTGASLLANGADPAPAGPSGVTALHVAASRGSVEIVEMLIRRGAAVSARDGAGRSAHDRAAAAGHASVVALLDAADTIPRDADATRRAYDVHGAPYVAPDVDDLSRLERGRVVGDAHRNLDAVVEATARNPRLAHAVATTNEGAIEAAAHMGRRDIVDHLLEHGAPYALPTAVIRRDAAGLRAMLAAAPGRIHERGAHDFALLWYPAIAGGDVELATILLDAGAEIERQHHLGTTALHWAAMAGRIDLVALLIERGADVNRRGRKFDASGQTALDLARRGEHDAVVRLLLDHGART